MENYYKILGLKNYDTKNLVEFYKNSVKKYKNLPFYSEKIKNEIMLLKEAYYVLSTESLKEVYDKSLKKSLKKNYNQDRDILRNNYNNFICSRNFVSFNKTNINIEKELELKKSKLIVNKKNRNYINE